MSGAMDMLSGVFGNLFPQGFAAGPTPPPTPVTPAPPIQSVARRGAGDATIEANKRRRASAATGRRSTMLGGGTEGTGESSSLLGG